MWFSCYAVYTLRKQHHGNILYKKLPKITTYTMNELVSTAASSMPARSHNTIVISKMFLIKTLYLLHTCRCLWPCTPGAPNRARNACRLPHTPQAVPHRPCPCRDDAASTHHCCLVSVHAVDYELIRGFARDTCHIIRTTACLHLHKLRRIISDAGR